MSSTPELRRAYTSDHRLMRRKLDAVVKSGSAVCAYCGEPILPTEPWDLGHTDNRLAWTGPEHRKCNRSTAIRVLRHSRRW